MVEIAAMAIDAGTLSTREINALIRTRLREGPAEISVENPNARHNLAVPCCNRDECAFWAVWVITAVD